MKVTYIGGPYDGKIEVSTALPPTMFVGKLGLTSPVRMESGVITKIDLAPCHIYALVKEKGRYRYIYKGES